MNQNANQDLNQNDSSQANGEDQSVKTLVDLKSLVLRNTVFVQTADGNLTDVYDLDEESFRGFVLSMLMMVNKPLHECAMAYGRIHRSRERNQGISENQSSLNVWFHKRGSTNSSSDPNNNNVVPAKEKLSALVKGLSIIANAFGAKGGFGLLQSMLEKSIADSEFSGDVNGKK